MLLIYLLQEVDMMFGVICTIRGKASVNVILLQFSYITNYYHFYFGCRWRWIRITHSPA